MHYDLLVTGVSNQRAKGVVIRHLAHDPSISLQKATSLVENLPVKLILDVDSEQAKLHIRKFAQLGVILKPVEHSAKPAKTPETIQLQSPEKAKQQTIVASISSKDVAGSLVLGNDSVQNCKHGSKGFYSSLQSIVHKKAVKALGSIVTILLLLLLFYSLTKNQNGLTLREQNSVTLSIARSDQKNIAHDNSSDGIKNQQKRKSIPEQNKKSSYLYVDSAKSSPSNETMIRFYKIAISFNRYNVNAWYGLINAYDDAGLTSESEMARVEMEELFGEPIFSIAEYVKNFGELKDAYFNEDGSYWLEYESRGTGEETLTKEAYSLSKALKALCNCNKAAIFAQNSKSKGLIAHVNLLYLKTLDQFRNEASLTFLK